MGFYKIVSRETLQGPLFSAGLAVSRETFSFSGQIS